MHAIKPKGSVGDERGAAAPARSPTTSHGSPARCPDGQALRSFFVALICALLLGMAAFALPAAAAGPPPSVRVFASQQRVSVTQGELRAGVVDLGLWVASVGGNFQVDVRRPNYGGWTSAQVDSATGALLRRLPSRLVDPSSGLKRFLSVRFLDSRGRVRALRFGTFCPNGESARVDVSGPLSPTYPGDCFSDAFFPFVRGIVWGIDSGWAVSSPIDTIPGLPPGFYGPYPPPGPSGSPPPPTPSGAQTGRLPPGAINLKPGRYRAIVSITAPYRQLFAIPATQASVTLAVRVLFTRPARRRKSVVVIQPATARAAHPLSAASVTQPDPSTLPNLVAAPAWAIAVRHAGRHDLLTFSATIWNAGPAPFSIEGFRRPDSNVMDAYEYFFDASGSVVGSAPAGTMFYDNERGHHHWHLRQLASYTLVGPRGEAIRSQKQSFCIAPTDAVDLTVPGADLAMSLYGNFGFGGSVCDLYSPGAIWLREDLPVGWGDTYQQWVAGQAIDVTNVPNGVYRLEVRVNPLGVLHETTTADDLSIRVIRLSGHRGARRVRVAPWHGIRR